MNKVETEVLEIPQRFVAIQLKGSEKVTVIDVCAFLRRSNDKGAKTKHDYADALLATARPFESMEAAREYMDKVEQTDSKIPMYTGVKHIVCEEGKVCNFLIRAVNRITDSYSTHEIESASFVVETDGKGEIALPLFLYFEKLGSLLNVQKEELNKHLKDFADNYNKLPLLETNKLKDELFKKLTPPKKEPARREQSQEGGYQEMDR